MSEKNAKLIRKIANLTGRTDTYIKKEVSNMSPELRVSYLTYMKENVVRMQEMRKEVERKREEA